MVLADFCLRLAWGLIASLLVLPAAQITPRFFRMQYLIALVLLALVPLTAAGFFLQAGWFHPWTLGIALSLACCSAGAIVWHLEGAPLARLIVYPAVLSVTWVLFAVAHEKSNLIVLDAFTSAALLGSCTTAMLLGHFYSLPPAKSLTPLLRLFASGLATLGLRVVLAGAGLIMALSRPEQLGALGLDIQDIVLLSTRWLLGFFGVLALGWMAWESARLRSTQSATGVLYIVVIFCIIGELLSQVLMTKRGLIL